MKITLTELLKKITPLPYVARQTRKGTGFTRDEFFVVLSKKIPKGQKNGHLIAVTGSTASRKSEASNCVYLVHAANVLPELVRHFQLLQELSDRNDYAAYRAAVAEIASSAITKADIIELP